MGRLFYMKEGGDEREIFHRLYQYLIPMVAAPPELPDVSCPLAG